MKSSVISYGYDRSKVRAGILHIGVGNFHRAHQEFYTNRLLEYPDQHGWGICGAMLLPGDERLYRILKKQGQEYTLTVCGRDGHDEAYRIGSLVELLWAGENPEAVLDRIADRNIRIITMTITEGGYNIEKSTGEFILDDKAVRHDLETPRSPQTVFGFIAEGLRRRRAAGNGPVTILSCDNLQHNGNTARKAFTSFIQAQDPELAEWLKDNVTFPDSMVDRITPATRPEDVIRLNGKNGTDDQAPVYCEDFIQWVIEDDFITVVPDFRASGALVVDDVMPYELMKIRLLNGSHSALSYPAYMMGYTMVDKAVSDPLIRKFIREYYMEEITETLSPVPGIDLDDYKDQLIKRFSNPYIADKVLRLASDGSKKISNAIFRPLEEAFAKGIPMDSVILALAMWEYYYQAVDSEGHHMPVDDPKGEELAAVSEDPQGFFRIAGLSESVLSSPLFTGKVREYLSSLRNDGVRKTLENYMS